MATYKYLAHDIISDQFVGELPFKGVRFSARLNRAGTFDARLTLPTLDDDPGWVRARDYLDGTDVNRRVIYVERDGAVLPYGYVVRSRSYDPASRTFDVTGEELWSLFSGREIRETTVLAGDQLHRARLAVAYSQFKRGGALRVLTEPDTLLSGVVRAAVVYNDYEARKVADVVEEIASLDDGFDFSIDVQRDSTGAITRMFRTFYPRQGRVAAETALVFEHGANAWLTWNEDGTAQVNSLRAAGAGSTDSLLVSVVEDTDVLDEGYPLIEDSLDLKEIAIPATLDARAAARLADVRLPVKLPKLVVRGDAEPEFGTYVKGDEARIVVPANRDPRFPDGLDTTARIVALDCVPPGGDGGVELATLTFDAAAA